MKNESALGVDTRLASSQVFHLVLLELLQSLLWHKPGRGLLVAKVAVCRFDVDSPFDSVKAMDEFMIRAWNSVVEVKDCVYILGDFSFYGVTKTKEIAKIRIVK